jgi:hypothetical protein
VEDARPHKEVGIGASYQRFQISPFALVIAGFTQLQKIFEGFERCRVSRFQGGSAEFESRWGHKIKVPLTRPDTRPWTSSLAD